MKGGGAGGLVAVGDGGVDVAVAGAQGVGDDVCGDVGGTGRGLVLGMGRSGWVGGLGTFGRPGGDFSACVERREGHRQNGGFC